MGSLLIFLCNIFFLIISSVFDIKKRIIPNRCVLFMLSAFLSVRAVEAVITGNNAGLKILLYWLFSSVCVLLFFIPAELISRKRFGNGDKKVLMVLALSLGSWGSVFLLFFMLSGAALYHVVLIGFNNFIIDRRKNTGEKVKMKGVYKTIPMAPFILASYIVVFFYVL